MTQIVGHECEAHRAGIRRRTTRVRAEAKRRRSSERERAIDA